MAIIARACAQILGVEALHTRDVRHTHRLLVRHILAVRQIPILSRCKAVLIFECATNLRTTAHSGTKQISGMEATNFGEWRPSGLRDQVKSGL